MYPVLFANSSFSTPTYLVWISLSYCLGILLLAKRIRSHQLDINHAMNLVLIILIFGFLGARIYHIFFEHFPVYLQDPWQSLRFWQGGFVFLGGAIFAYAACFIYTKKKKISFLSYADSFAPVLLFTYGFGRLACFWAGCCFGKECHLPWAVEFPLGVEAPAFTKLHPTQLYSSVWNILGYFFFLTKEAKLTGRKGSLFALCVGYLSLGRIIVEQFRGDNRGENLLGVSQASWISFAVLVLSLYWLWSKKNHIKSINK